MLEQQKVVKEFAMSMISLILVLQKKTTEVSQVANMLLISNKISINKNKQIYFFYFFLFFSIDILHFPTAVGTEWLFIACESWVNNRIRPVFLLLTALIRNFYKAIIQRLDVKRCGLNLSDNSVMRGRVHARRTLKGLVADLRK